MRFSFFFPDFWMLTCLFKKFFFLLRYNSAGLSKQPLRPKEKGKKRTIRKRNYMARSEKEQSFLFSYSSVTGINGFCLCQRVGLQSPCGGVPWGESWGVCPSDFKKGVQQSRQHYRKRPPSCRGSKEPHGLPCCLPLESRKSSHKALSQKQVCDKWQMHQSGAAPCGSRPPLSLHSCRRSPY